MVTEFPVVSVNSVKEFKCIICNVICSRKHDWERHILTGKHAGNVLGNKKSIQTTFTCEFCSKLYKSRKGLWSHNKTCTSTTQIIQNDYSEPAVVTEAKEEKEKEKEKDKVIDLLIKENADFKNIILEFMKNNSDMQKQLIDVCKNSNNNTTNHINSHNKTFNLQFFLNEQCKDAMNINDFVSSFDLQLADLESVGELGYVDGITKIIVDKLNAMDIYKRPMHCSDAKRETIYIKDEDIWTKEGPGNPKLRQAIKKVSFNNMKLVYNWSNAYPESMDNKSRLNDTYIKLVLQSTGGSGPILESENKIIRRIAKEIVIDKL
jgi:hypothetical protein